MMRSEAEKIIREKVKYSLGINYVNRLVKDVAIF